MNSGICTSRGRKYLKNERYLFAVEVLITHLLKSNIRKCNMQKYTEPRTANDAAVVRGLSRAVVRQSSSINNKNTTRSFAKITQRNVLFRFGL